MSSNDFDKLHQMMCPPGNGVYTVNTARERKADLHQKMYGVSDDEGKINHKWMEELKKAFTHKGPLLFGICSDCGGGIQRGANWGPLFIRNEIHGKSVDDLLDLGDIRVIPHLLHDKYLNETTLSGCREALYGKPSSKLAVSPLSIAEDCLEILYSNNPEACIFGMGGDHSVSYPLVKSWLKRASRQKRKAALLHFDAHTDLLVDRLGIDLCFGSWVTHILDGLSDPSLAVQVGIRSSGKPKEHWQKTFGVIQHWAGEVNRRGPEDIAEEIIRHYKSNGVEEVYISFDIDALDEKYASATGTPEPDGLSPDCCARIIRDVASEFKVTGADLVEVAPFVSAGKGKNPEPDTTMLFAGSLANIMLEALSGN